MNVRAIAVLVLVVCCGCEPPAASNLAKTGPPPPPSVGVQMAELQTTAESPDTSAVAEEAVAEPASLEPMETAATQAPAGAVEPPATDPAEPAPVSKPPLPTSPTRQPIVRLSAGAALPQLLPEGTQVGVSVDYRVTGRLSTSARYALVVESAGGQVAVPVELASRGGTIEGFLPATVRPEHKPFRAWIDELAPGSRSSVMVSNKLDLQTSY